MAIRYMMSFIEPFKALSETWNWAIHVRSTFLIALPALIARELGLKVLYEVMVFGNWYIKIVKTNHIYQTVRICNSLKPLTMKVDQLWS